MKRLILAAFLCLSLFNGFGQRFSVVPGSDNKYAIPHKEMKSVAFASTITLYPFNEETTYFIASPSGAATINITEAKSVKGDRMILVFAAATGSSRTITWGTNMVGTSSTLSVTTARTFVVHFVYDGNNWVQSQ